jgi:DNA-binding CsgD family transcriptional regulator
MMLEILKYLLLISAYTLGIGTLIVQIVCYLKDLEYKETILLTLSFLLLIVTATIQNLISIENEPFLVQTKLATIVSTILLAVAIPINIHVERIVSRKPFRDAFAISAGSIAMLLAVALFYSSNEKIAVLLTSLFLFGAVFYSMVLILVSVPQFLIKPYNNSERVGAVFIIVSMILNLIIIILFGGDRIIQLAEKIGPYILSIICIVLSVVKLPNDIRKLTELGKSINLSKDNLKKYGVSPREAEVVELLIAGKAYKEIASQLFISLPTVKTHVSNIYQKLNVRNRLELANRVKHQIV